MPLNVPLRISTSTKTTFLFVWAILMARLLETKVLPAPGLAEVNITTCRLFDFTRMNSMFVRTMRNASETESRPLSRTTIPSASSPFLLPWRGISPKKGMVKTWSNSLRVRTLVSVTFNNHKTPMGITAPKATAAKRIIIDLGATGLLLPEAGSIIRALLSVIACVKAFSSRLFNR